MNQHKISVRWIIAQEMTRNHHLAPFIVQLLQYQPLRGNTLIIQLQFLAKYSKTTAYREIDRWVAKKILRRTKQGKKTFYTIPSIIKTQFLKICYFFQLPYTTVINTIETSKEEMLPREEVLWDPISPEEL